MRGRRSVRDRALEPAPARTSGPFAALLALTLLLALAACAGEFDTPGEALRLVQPTLPNAVLREPYEAPVHAVGGLRPYHFELEAGELPEGVTLQNGSLRGTPSETGSFTFTVVVSDANLNKTVQEYRLTVTEVPPPTFSLGAPQTEVRDAVTLRARVQQARGLGAVRALVRWDPAAFRLVPGSVTAGASDLALLSREGEGELQVDLVLLGRTLDGDRELFSFTLEPLTTPASLQVDYQVELLSQGADPERQHHFVRQSEGRQASPTPAGAPATDGAGATGPDDEDPDPDAPPAGPGGEEER